VLDDSARINIAHYGSVCYASRMNAYSTAKVMLLVSLAAIWLPAAYVASYYLACDYGADPSQAIVIRRYRYQWQRCLFDPAAKLESSATLSEVVIPDNYSPDGGV
jgi:hypothetical protein